MDTRAARPLFLRFFRSLLPHCRIVLTGFVLFSFFFFLFFSRRIHQQVRHFWRAILQRNSAEGLAGLHRIEWRGRQRGSFPLSRWIWPGAHSLPFFRGVL